MEIDPVALLATITAGVVAIIVASHLSASLAQRLKNRGPGGSALEARLQAMERRLREAEGKVDDLTSGARERIAELEERVDFTERLLQRGRDQHASPGNHE